MADDSAKLPPPPPGYEALPALPPPPPGYEPVGAPGLMESFLRGAAEGATFGFDDKLGLSKEAREASRKANPWLHFAGELAGGAIPMLAAAALPTGVSQGAAAGRAAQLAGRGAQLAKSALLPAEINTLKQAGVQGAKLGAVYGGLSGAGHADVKPEDSYLDALTKRAGEGVLGGATGALIGAPLGLLGHGIYRGGEYLGGLKSTAAAETDVGSGALTTALRNFERDRITPDTVIAAIRSEFPDDTAAAGLTKRFWGGLQNKQPITADHVEEVVRRAMAGEDAAAISAALKQKMGGVGPGEDAVQSLLDELAARHLGPLNLIDRAAMVRTGSGDNTQMSMRAAAATPGEQKGIARENLLERQLGAGARIHDALARGLGAQDFDAAMVQHEKRLSAAADRMYDAARANEQPFDLNPVFAKWSAKFGNMRGAIPDTINSWLDAMRSTQPVLNQAGQLAKQPPGGIVNKAPPMDLQGFIYARQGLRDARDAAIQRGEKGLARELTQLYGDLTDEVARTNPLWKEANDFFRDGALGTDSGKAGAAMALRLNSQSREGLKDFTTAVQAERKTTSALREAKATLKRAEARQDAAAAAAARVEVDRLTAKLDAAQAQQELFKLGLLRAISDKYLINEGETHNLTKQLLKPGAQKILREVLGPDGDMVINKLKAEAAMHRTYSSQFGSQTTPLREHIDEQNWAPNFEAAWSNLGFGKILQLAQEYAARSINTRRNTDLMKMYTETDPLKQLEYLKAMGQLQTSRQNVGNVVGKPFVGAGAGLLPQHEAAVDAERRHPTVLPQFKREP